MFTGEYEHSIDDKGRVIVPTKMRQGLGSQCYLTRGYHQNISVYNEVEFQKLMELLVDNSKVDLDVVALQHRFAATEATIDSQGRLPLTKALMDWAGIAADQKAVVLFGTVDRVEIWSKELWSAHCGAQDDKVIFKSSASTPATKWRKSR